MLFYNPNIRRKITYKKSVKFGKPQERELYSYSIFNDSEEIEFVFDEKITNIYKYNNQNNFLDSLKVYDKNNELSKKYFFDITKQENNIIEFKESFFKRDKQVGCYGKLAYEDIEHGNNFCRLTFHRVDSYLGYRIELRIVRNNNGDFSVEEFYNTKTNELQFILENEFEYFESDLEIRAQMILKNGWL